MKIFNNPVCQLVTDISGSLSEYFSFCNTTANLISRTRFQIKCTAVLTRYEIIAGLYMKMCTLYIIQDITEEIAMILESLWTKDTTDRKIN